MSAVVSQQCLGALSTGPPHRGKCFNGLALEFNLVLLLVLPLGAHVVAEPCVVVVVVVAAVADIAAVVAVVVVGVVNTAVLTSFKFQV